MDAFLLNNDKESSMKADRTQMDAAKQGVVTPEMAAVAASEYLPPEFIRDGVAAGTIVIPANVNHTGLKPMGIGRALRTKINSNIGNSQTSSCPKNEFEKLDVSLKYGADTIMDLSTRGDLALFRKELIRLSPIPVGTVPVYEIAARAGAGKFDRDTILEVVEDQAKQGVDYMTIHAGLLAKHIPAALKRKLGIVSRGGALIAAWIGDHKMENPFYEAFDDILKICRDYEVTLSLGDGLRPGCIADASDEAQFGELDVIGELVRRCRAANVQAMVEGPGHVPFNQIEMNMKREQQVCGDAPFYILGPVVTDCAPGYDHMVAAMGGLAGAYWGAAMLCYVTPKEHLGLPDTEDVRRGVVAFKIAAHAADVALGRPHAQERDNAISDARADFDWERQFSFALDPDRAREYRHAALQESHCAEDAASGKYCTMCGPDFCSVRLSNKLKEMNK